MRNPCMAHRGWSGIAPENTMSAIRLATDHPEIDMIEIDVQMSRDGVPVIFHDYTLERTTNGSGWVGEHTLRELKQLDAGSWFAPEFTGETIPTLEEVFQWIGDKKAINLEIKRAGGLYPDIVRCVTDLIQKFGLETSVVITSFHHETVREVSLLAPNIKTGLIIYGMPMLLDEQLAASGATILSMSDPYLTESFVRTFLDRGIEVYAWTIDHPEHMKRVAAMDERIKICTNHPDRWLELKK